MFHQIILHNILYIIDSVVNINSGVQFILVNEILFLQLQNLTVELLFYKKFKYLQMMLR